MRDISNIPGVSAKTVERRMSKFGLSVSGITLYVASSYSKDTRTVNT